MAIKHIFTGLLFSLLSFTAGQVVAAEKDQFFTTKVSGGPISIDLPSNMKEVKKKENDGFILYQYATGVDNSPSNSVIKMMAIKLNPDDKANYQLWQTEALISQLTHLVKEYNLSMKDMETSDKVIGSKGDDIKIGENTYKEIKVEFDKTHAEFLNTIKDGVLYIFTLVSIDPNDDVREKNLERLKDQMKSMRLQGMGQSIQKNEE